MIPYKYKLPGWILVSAGFVLALLYFMFDLRFKIPVMAVISSYTKTRFFAFFRTNFADELIFLLLLSGFSLIVFSKEKIENEITGIIRRRSLVKAVIVDIAILMFAVLFFYGSIFLSIVIINTILPFILYLAFFHFSKACKKDL